MINKKSGRGRPLSFDKEAALWNATKTFWQSGYEGASIQDLTESMGLSPQSLYSAYGSKASLYESALDLYQARIGNERLEELDRVDVIDCVSALLDRCAREFTDHDLPRGCLISMGTLLCSPEHGPVSDLAKNLRLETISAIERRLEQGVQEGQVKNVDVSTWARFFGSVMQGMSVQARDGATYEDLGKVGRMAVEHLRGFCP
jgi:AcrR family transcriptional regulator